jgi:hypothetical protein
VGRASGTASLKGTHTAARASPTRSVPLTRTARRETWTQTLEPPRPQPRPVAAAAAETAQAASATTAVAGSLASPGAAVQVARVVGVMGIARRCRGGAGRAPGFALEQLEFPQSLVPSLGIGAAEGSPVACNEVSYTRIRR